LTNISN